MEGEHGGPRKATRGREGPLSPAGLEVWWDYLCTHSNLGSPEVTLSCTVSRPPFQREPPTPLLPPQETGQPQDDHRPGEGLCVVGTAA